MPKDDKLNNALFSKAVGCTTSEVVEEYALDDQDGSMHLVKKKVTTKKLPPDISAVKTLLEFYGTQNKFENLSDEELYSERNKLIELLKSSEVENGNCGIKTQDEM